MPRSPALDALDPQHVELADQVAEDGRAIAACNYKGVAEVHMAS